LDPGADKADRSSRFLDATVADARGANAHLLAGAIDKRAHVLEVGIPAAPSRIVRVADHIAKMRTFAAQLTLRHLFLPTLL
jgi:hypothetical protein